MIAAAFLFTLLAIVGLTFAIRALLTSAGQRVGRRIARVHQELEEIVEQGRIPVSWIEEAMRRTRNARGSPSKKRARMQRFLLERLAEMRPYCLKSSMVDGPETRELLLDGLDRAQREWTERGFEEALR